MNALRTLITGATVMGTATIALYFLRFWQTTRDRLFLLFAIAFATLAVHWTALALSDPAAEFRPLLYGLRLVAFILILVAIADKNRPRR